MENSNPLEPSQVALHKRHFKSFWPIVFLATISALIGGALVWAFFNQGLDEELNALVPGKFIVHKKQTASSQTELKDWQTYTNKEYGFSFQYGSKWEVSEGLEDGHTGLRLFLKDDDEGSASITISKMKLNGPFSEFLKNNREGLALASENSQKYNSGTWTITKTFDKSNELATGFFSANILVDEYIYSVNSLDFKESEDMDNQILSTFKFIN